MKRKMELKDVWGYYGDKSIIQTHEGFEVSSRFPGVKLVLPREFQVFIDGSLIDPARLLKMPPYLWNKVFKELVPSLEVEYLCGNCVVDNIDCKAIKFYPGDPMGAMSDINAVLIKIYWDMREGASDVDWAKWLNLLYGDNIVWSRRETDWYETAGNWCFLIKIGDMQAMYAGMPLGLVELAIIYLTTLRPVYQVANEVLEKFEREKGEYRARITEIVASLTESADWKVSSDEDETVLKNEVSPGHWKVYRYRHDLIGFTMCAQDFAWKEN